MTMEPIYAPYVPYTETLVIDPADFLPNIVTNSRYRIAGPPFSQDMLALLLDHIRSVGPYEDHREFPCEECDQGEYVLISGPNPSTGTMTYECDECSHEVRFP